MYPSNWHELNTWSLADAALAYHAKEWWPIPLQGKRPITNWTTDPPLTDEQLRLLYPDTDRLAPHLNIGLRMGACSGLIALDIDGQDGRQYITDHLTPSDIAELQQTIQFCTPNNGHRLIYRYPTNPQPSRSLRDPKDNRRELVRILSDGTQTVAPPSDIDGRPYLWTHHHYPLAPWPDHIVKKLEPDQGVIHRNFPSQGIVSDNQKMRRAVAYLRKCDPAISGQRGHNQTYKIAIRLTRGFGLSYHEALALITEIYNPTCQPPWTDAELEHKIESALADTSPTRNML
jgi:hypothetical protein